MIQSRVRSRLADRLACRCREIVSAALSVDIGDLTAPTRRRARVAHARQVAMYMAHVALGLSMTEVGRTFGRCRSTAVYACRIIEERREDTGFDAFIRRLESLLAQLSLEKRSFGYDRKR